MPSSPVAGGSMERPELERILDGLGRMIQRGALRAILETPVASSDGDQPAVSDASDALNAFGGFFWPVIEAFEDTLPLTLSKALDRDKRTMSLRGVLRALDQDAGLARSVDVPRQEWLKERRFLDQTQGAARQAPRACRRGNPPQRVQGSALGRSRRLRRRPAFALRKSRVRARLPCRSA